MDRLWVVGQEEETTISWLLFKENMDKEYRGMEILDGMGRAKVKFWTCRF